MSINFKPINEVPVIDGFSDGDMVLVNSGGTAKQIDASKVGGGGGGGTIYTNADITSSSSETLIAPAYSDPEYTNQLTYEQGVEILASGGKIQLTIPDFGQFFWLTPLAIVPADGEKMIQCMCIMEGMIAFVLTFSDSAMGD